ncbi:DUF3263 domain-containing protein [Rhodococcus sp. GXMU-t2271]|uniref:DUF3263 domain-containing protein n=2 Tax=Rhodococcus indonesiensis TaxID=3055869 RepID=A0ABT7RQ15_9NOCA|nr:DUF3263 domain-containing protein [Rhodococcus indonesiensis]
MPYQAELLDFAVEWAPYGGGDEHVLPTFGLDLTEYYRRLLHLLDTPVTRSMDPATILQLRQQCSKRLASPTQDERIRSVCQTGHHLPLAP